VFAREGRRKKKVKKKKKIKGEREREREKSKLFESNPRPLKLCALPLSG
jgi:hypothetical protein